MKIKRILFNFENAAASSILLLLAVIPVIEILLRTFFRSGFEASSEYTAHIVLWITFLGAMITSRNNQHLAISVGVNKLGKKLKNSILIFNNTLSTAISFAFAISGFSMILSAFDKTMMIGIFPMRLIQC